MNVDLLGALARLRVNELLAGAATRRSLLRDRKPSMTLRFRIAWALRRFGEAAIVLGDAVGTRVV